VIKGANARCPLTHERLGLVRVVPNISRLGLLLELFYLSGEGRDVKETP